MPKTPLHSWTPETESAYLAAERWLAANPAAAQLGVDAWKQLHLAAAGKWTDQDLLDTWKNHLYTPRARVRWKDQPLTDSFLRAARKVGAAVDKAQPDFVRTARQKLGQEGQSLLAESRAMQMKIFARAVEKIIAGRENNDPSTPAP